MSRTSNRRRTTAQIGPSVTDQREFKARSPAGVDQLVSVLVKHGWTVVLILLCSIIALQLGAIDWYADDQLSNPDGTSERIPNTFASIDHPFHINKEREVLDAIRNGNFPRWFSNHQAGYPAEFYPPGADIVVVAGWGLGLGLIPLEIVHKLVIIAILFIPVVAYWVIARRDGWPASVAVTAAVLHLFLPGAWFGGGPDELLRMGMWPNVFAAYLTLPLMLWGADYLRRGSHVGLVLASGAASLAIYTNPRAAIAVATILMAVGIIARSECQIAGKFDQRQIALRTLLLSLVVVLLTATLTVPLRAHQGLYEFTRFVEFSSVAKVWEYFSGALPVEVTIVAVIGAIIAARTERFHSRVLALWLLLAAFVSVVAGGLLRDFPMLAQLEGPRLLPLVRLPALFLAAVAIHTITRYVFQNWMPTIARRFAGIAAVALVAAVLLTPISTLSTGERGLPPIETTDQPAFSAIARNVAAYTAVSAETDRPLIIGSPLSEHSSFWIPALSNSAAFHSAWIWYWKTPDYADRTRIADVAAALEPDFLRRHALTFVLIAANDADTMAIARSRPHLKAIETGESQGFAIFRVAETDPSVYGPISVDSGEVRSLEWSHQRLLMNLHATEPAEVRVAINQFPAWQATINGRDTPIRQTAEGYMLIDIPAGDVALTLTYAVVPAVWIGRVLTALGILLLVAIVTTGRVHRGTH